MVKGIERLPRTTENLEQLRKSIPEYVTVVAAAKTRTTEEVTEAIRAGIKVIGENYVQEAARKYKQIGNQAQWHMIGHLQRNKVNKALEIFDCIQTIDSTELAEQINRQCQARGKTISVLLEVNIAAESSKSGVRPEQVINLARAVAAHSWLRVQGLMTIEPFFDHPEKARPFFKQLKEMFDQLKKEAIPGVDMQTLSMGMSNSYRIAIEEGSNMVRLGTAIWGPREY